MRFSTPKTVLFPEGLIPEPIVISTNKKLQWLYYRRNKIEIQLKKTDKGLDPYYDAIASRFNKDVRETQKAM
jgi:hypothetical protein